MLIKGQCVVPGKVKGISIVSSEPISFLGDINPFTGQIIAEGHPLKGESIADKIFVFPCGKGSTVGSYIIYQLYKNGKAPRAIINNKVEAIVAVGAIISNIPLIHEVNISEIPPNAEIFVNATEGIIEF
ncbi:MAG: DUF126 domain-containing protein [Promethearchaeota archaeon]